MCDCLCVILCAFVLVISFASFFGPSVLPYFPLWKFLIKRTPDSKNQWGVQIFGSSAKHYETLSRLHYIGNIWPECKCYPGLTISIKFTSLRNHHNCNEPAGRQFVCKTTVHFQSEEYQGHMCIWHSVRTLQRKASGISNPIFLRTLPGKLTTQGSTVFLGTICG